MACRKGLRNTFCGQSRPALASMEEDDLAASDKVENTLTI